MRFSHLVETYEALGQTSRRTESRQLLAGLFRPLPPEEIAPVVYLSLGMLRPEFEGVELGVAGALARKVVALAVPVPDARVAALLQERGDLGSVAEELLARAPRVSPPSSLTVDEVYETFQEIARTAGPGSQDRKVSLAVGLLVRATSTEAKYLVRFLIGELRLGVKDQTILDALALAFGGGERPAREKIETAYNLSSDLGEVASRLAAKGLEGLDAIHIRVGRPIRPMLAEREASLKAVLERMEGRAALEFKYDGLRVQAHVPAKGEVRLFSRRLEEIGAQFPDITDSLPSAVADLPAILEGECVPIDPETDEIRPFQEVSRRRGRKHDLDRLQEEVPVCLFVFDVLLAGGEPVYDRPFPERRAALERMVRPSPRVRVAVQQVVDSVAKAQSFFDGAVEAGAEGVMAKSLAPQSAYRAGARGFWWIKYKREYTAGLADSIDGVVIGGFHGRGRRAGRYGAYLLAVYNPPTEKFESFTKVGTGFDDPTLVELARRVEPLTLSERPSGVETGLAPDAWFRPSLVLEVRGAELTLSPVHRAALGRIRPGAGLALRFPRFTGRIRDDKGPTDATTVVELVKMYHSQVRRVDSSASSETPP